MLKNSKEFLSLHRKAKEIYKKYTKEIVDIIIFGSFVKGKLLVRDIDICVILKDKLNEELTNKVKNIFNEREIHLSYLIIDNFFLKQHSLSKTLLKEGVSLISKKSLSENLGFLQYVLYSYSLKEKQQKEKTKIVYLLKGRNKKPGFVSSVNGEWVTDNCFIVPVAFDNEIIKILTKWQVKYERKNILIG